MFKTLRFMDLSLPEWVPLTPPELVMQRLEISEETLNKVPRVKQVLVGDSGAGSKESAVLGFWASS